MRRAPLHLCLAVALAGCSDDRDPGGSTGGTGGGVTETTGGPTGDPGTSAGPGGPGATEPATDSDDPAATSGETASSSGAIDRTTGETTTTGESTSTGEHTTGGTDTTGDADTSTGDADECLLALHHAPCDADSDDPLHALGLDCTRLGAPWLDAVNAVDASDVELHAPAPTGGRRSWQVARAYGTHVDPATRLPFWSPREGDKLLLISSGLLPAPDGQGAVIVADGDVYNDSGKGGVWDSDEMPPPMKPGKGSLDPLGFSDCDGVHDCSNTIDAQWQLGGGDAADKTWFHFQLTAPSLATGAIADVHGYTFDFAFFSAEFPEFVGDIYNDIFVVWQDSEDYTGNVTFIDGQPLTVTALWPVDFQGADPQLAGTGFREDGLFSDGGATGWYRASGGVEPGETFTLAFAVFDMGDSDYDTTALLDNWQWDCEGCVPNEVDSCGIRPQ